MTIRAMGVVCINRLTKDLKKIDVPTLFMHALVMHGEDDQIVAVKDPAEKVGQTHQGRKGYP